MSLLITGHTSGIGKYIYEKFGGVGLSKSNGFDITINDITPWIDSDTIFINNAFTLSAPLAQITMLHQTATCAKKVICIGTNSQYEGIYKDAKDELQSVCSSYFRMGKDVTYLALGKVDTPYTQLCHPNDPVISKEEIISYIEFIMSSKNRIEIFSVRPD